jgi:hypothetical protein
MAVLDKEVLLVALNGAGGRRFLGAVDGGDAVELVFENVRRHPNLVSIYTDCRRAGAVEVGGVADAAEYVASYLAHRRSGGHA